MNHLLSPPFGAGNINILNFYFVNVSARTSNATVSTWLDCSRLMSDFRGRSRKFINACFYHKTHRFLPLYVLGNRSKTLLLPIICKGTDLPTASRLRSEGTSPKPHRLNIYSGIVPSNANILEPIREPPAPPIKSYSKING